MRMVPFIMVLYSWASCEGWLQRLTEVRVVFEVCLRCVCDVKLIDFLMQHDARLLVMAAKVKLSSAQGSKTSALAFVNC